MVQTFRRILFAGLIVIGLNSCVSNTTEVNNEGVSITISDADKKLIEQHAKNLPLILTNEGWEAYEKNFAKEYFNWSMLGDNVRPREEFLGLVKDWYDAGNRATDSEIKTIGFIPVSEDTVLYLHAQVEEFNDPDDPDITRSRDIRFVSLYKKEDGQWKVFFTGFMDKLEG